MVIAILNLDEKGKNIPDEIIQQSIIRLKGEHKLSTYISLSCTNCPEVVQALNLVSIINPRIKHEIIDINLFRDEARELNIQGVPTVYHNNEIIQVGKATLSELISKLEISFGTDEAIIDHEIKKYDVIVVGGGPAGTSAAIYSARKGLKVAVVADRKSVV